MTQSMDVSGTLRWEETRVGNTYLVLGQITVGMISRDRKKFMWSSYILGRTDAVDTLEQAQTKLVTAVKEAIQHE